MIALPQKTGNTNFFLRMHPLQRVVISLVIAGLVFFPVWANYTGGFLITTILWDVFALSYLLISWVIFFTHSQKDIMKHANVADGSRPYVLGGIIVTSFASLIAVLLLILSKHGIENNILVPLIAIAGMMLSWAMVHTLFTFHYARMYYGKNKAMLQFPEEDKPDYLDFAYFSFVVGMTFQVSDVQIVNKVMRKTVLAHSLLAFAINTFVVALTINLIAGLRS